MDIPPIFDERFLIWLRRQTERAWAADIPEIRWLPGLSEADIDDIERRWAIRFPPDYRLFLRLLHAVGEVVPASGLGRKHLSPIRLSKIVYNWQLDTKALKGALAWPTEGLLPHKRRKNGPTLEEEQLRLRLADAPRLIPLAGHCYLVGEPRKAGNPVLSVYGTDIIPYGADLRGFLLIHFSRLLSLDHDRAYWQYGIAPDGVLRPIPFWGEFFN